jgi:Fur family peroxide stress response transcriptional regulator
MLTVSTAREALHKAGIRITPQRLMVVDVLVDNRTHPTVDQVYLAVSKHYPTVSLATIYSTLSLLARNGLILALHGGKDGLRSDPETTPHAHAYCEQCGDVYDVALPDEPVWKETHLSGFQPRHTEISLYGLCAHCAQTTPQS